VRTNQFPSEAERAKIQAAIEEAKRLVEESTLGPQVKDHINDDLDAALKRVKVGTLAGVAAILTHAYYGFPSDHLESIDLARKTIRDVASQVRKLSPAQDTKKDRRAEVRAGGEDALLYVQRILTGLQVKDLEWNQLIPIVELLIEKRPNSDFNVVDILFYRKLWFGRGYVIEHPSGPARVNLPEEYLKSLESFMSSLASISAKAIGKKGIEMPMTLRVDKSKKQISWNFEQEAAHKIVAILNFTRLVHLNNESKWRYAIEWFPKETIASATVGEE
jgi:hypothetical protein